MYAAHDDLSIYGIGQTAEAALADAQLAADGDYQVSPIEPGFAARIERGEFDPNHDSFDFDGDTIVSPNED